MSGQWSHRLAPAYQLKSWTERCRALGQAGIGNGLLGNDNDDAQMVPPSVNVLDRTITGIVGVPRCTDPATPLAGPCTTAFARLGPPHTPTTVPPSTRTTALTSAASAKASEASAASTSRLAGATMMAGTGRVGSSLVAGAIALTGRLPSTRTIQRSGGTTGRLLASATTKSESRWSRSVAIQIASPRRGPPADRSKEPPAPISTRGAQANGAAQGWP